MARLSSESCPLLALNTGRLPDRAPCSSVSFQKEIQSLEAKLADVESWKKRLGEIDEQLHFKTATA